MSDNGQEKNILTIIKNITYINKANINITNTSNDSLHFDKNCNYLFLGIILILIIIIIISILILIYLFKKKAKTNSIIGLNKIVINNNSNKGFQKVQNTSKVNDIIQSNNVLNEIKTHNLKEEIHKIINTSSSSNSLGGGKKSKRKRLNNSNLNTSGGIDGKNDNNNINESNSKDKENIIENNSDINTQKLEQELKEQIKKYVVEDHNI